MELILGYKQTEVGVIPNEWDVIFDGSLQALVSLCYLEGNMMNEFYELFNPVVKKKL